MIYVKDHLCKGSSGLLSGPCSVLGQGSLYFVGRIGFNSDKMIDFPSFSLLLFPLSCDTNQDSHEKKNKTNKKAFIFAYLLVVSTWKSTFQTFFIRLGQTAQLVKTVQVKPQ